MKKIFFLPWILVFVSVVCFSAGVSASSDAGDRADLIQSETTGKVDSVSVQEVVGGQRRQVILRNAKGIQTTFAVAPDAIIKGKDGSSTGLNWIKGHEVSVKYVIGQDGFTQTITSIQVL